MNDPKQNPPASQHQTLRSTSKRKKILFRVGAIGVGLLPLVVLELILIATGWHASDAVRDPYIGFTENRPLFVENEDGTRFEIAGNRKPLFQPDSFLIKKPKDDFRIFCIGGSTVQGRPFSIETAFPKWMELSLSAADDTRRWRAINCGGVSYASYRLVPIVNEILTYQPDLIVLYTGHNEFLEDRTYASIKSNSGWVGRTHERLSALRTYSFLRDSFVSQSKQTEAETLPVEVEARLDFKGGLDLYQRDDAWKEKVVVDFQNNLRRIVRQTQVANVPLILVNPVCNLRDVAPFKSESAPELSPVQREDFDLQWRAFLKERDSWTAEKVLSTLESLAEFNPRHADLQFRLGHACLQADLVARAKRHLIAAKEEDICPLRATEPIYEAIDRVQQEFKIPFVDAMEFFVSKSSDGIPGRESLVDHVHPTIHGHQLIAELIVAKMIDLDIVETAPDAAAKADCYREHLESLDNFYFERAKDRLNGLQRWAEGKVRHKRETDAKP